MANEKNRAYAGNRNRRIEIVEYTTIKNELGEDKKTPVSVGIFYAKMDDLSGNEGAEGKIIHIVNRTYTIPYIQAIRDNGENMVIKDLDKEFRVYYVQEIGSRLQLLLKCTVRE